jgi:hypothetical protein
MTGLPGSFHVYAERDCVAIVPLRKRQPVLSGEYKGWFVEVTPDTPPAFRIWLMERWPNVEGTAYDIWADNEAEVTADFAESGRIPAVRWLDPDDRRLASPS